MEAVVAPPWLLCLHSVSRRVMVAWRNIVHLVSWVRSVWSLGDDGECSCCYSAVGYIIVNTGRFM